MAASFFVNTLQVEFESVLAMEHTGMTRMIKSLEDFCISEEIIPEKPAGGDTGSTAGGPEDIVATPPELETQDGDGSNIPAQDDHMECRNETSNVDEQEEHVEGANHTEQVSQDGAVFTNSQGELDKYTDGGTESFVEYEERIENSERMESSNQTEMEAATNEEAIVERRESAQPAEKPTTYIGKEVFASIKIRKINCVTYFLPKIDSADKGKGVLPHFDRPNPFEENYLLVFGT
ncbi:bromodomain and WD repeat-containing protein 1 [Dorcoceras hygrometricum]|uniref:Bromodomain and WD repeat-containing protein 1 n=1 Tax=Dorcoceras hygrometricum TaxID=472368 RepID=A0A2Z6ZYZ6_9LAMI|nr:bromodomain and WD repeat-containing protein 1 [Dorcoceras hygrometricum]